MPERRRPEIGEFMVGGECPGTLVGKSERRAPQPATAQTAQLSTAAPSLDEIAERMAALKLKLDAFAATVRKAKRP
jgi:hypothetical protein